ncbi:MAG: minor capsid protein [Methanomassiliicoccales archaeon]|jgi:SPP1 gp7 family putative phage head morphogenesis protein
MASAINVKDPSGLRATEDRRALEMQRDLDAAAQKAIDRIVSGKVTDPTQIQAIVDSELKNYSAETKAKIVKWINDTWVRSDLRSQKLIRAAGGKITVSASLGPTGVLPEDVRKAVEINVQNNIDSLSADVKKKLTASIIDGMKEGEGPRVIAKRISEEIGMERSRAQLIARTETMNAYRSGSSAQYEKYGIQEEKWLTAHDDRTCDECAAHDGAVYPVGQRPRVHGGTDIQCRCIGLPVIPGVG